MDAIECKKAVAVWLAVALLFSTVLAACGSGLEVGVETTPTTDVAATATVSALATENAHLATQVATLAVPTPTPTSSLGKLTYVQGGDIWVKACLTAHRSASPPTAATASHAGRPPVNGWPSAKGNLSRSG